MTGPTRAASVTLLWRLALAAALLAVAGAPELGAQTPFSSLAAPNGGARSSPPARKPAAERAKPCSGYGAGYVAVQGSETCVKFGATVRTDAVVNMNR